ncbi:MAG: glycosyltransferase family 1 protein [Bacteroidota bacterium]|jgi:glycosyltransferase involved in cell wall biosynthesis
MNVGINLLYLIPGIVGGTETYARNLIYHLVSTDENNVYYIFVPTDARYILKDLPENGKIIEVPIFSNKVNRILWEQFVLPIKVYKYKISILFSLGYVIPIFARCKHIVTIHDLLYKRFSYTIPKSKRVYWRLFIPLSVSRAAKVIAVSKFTNDELIHYFPRAAEKIIVTQLGVDGSKYYPDMSKGNGIFPEKFIVCVATLSPHKNLEIILKAVHALKMMGTNVNLVLVGNKERATKDIERSVDKLGISQQISLLGYVSDEKLRQIYSIATLFVLPSIYEGFGLPVLEAMACGCPVICSHAGSLPEVGGNAAKYFNPFDLEEIVALLKQVYFDEQLRNEMKGLGFKNVEKFRWSVTAKNTMNCINKLA